MPYFFYFFFAELPFFFIRLDGRMDNIVVHYSIIAHINRGKYMWDQVHSIDGEVRIAEQLSYIHRLQKIVRTV